MIRGIAMLVLLSPLCFGAAWLVRAHGEGALYFGWFGSLTVAGFVSAWVWPRCVVWGALWITWSQSAWLYLQLDTAGEMANPSSSTGGKAGWAIVTTLLVMFSPLPALASWFGRRTRAARVATAVGSTPRDTK